MRAATTERTDALESAEALAPEVRAALRDLLLSLADSKRLLGIRYSDWMLGAPSLETGIAAASMAQDEWGHARLTYALLSDFGDDPKQLEHGRGAEEYRSIELLDAKLGSWTELVMAVLLLDTALTVQYAALAESRYSPVRNRVHKLLDEEAFHFQYAAGWAERLATSGARAAMVEAADRLLPVALRWLGGAGEGLERLHAAGVADEDADGLTAQFLRCVGAVLDRAGIGEELGLTPADQGWVYTRPLSWTGWSTARRRSGAGGPDADTLARVRGDRNRAMLID